MNPIPSRLCRPVQTYREELGGMKPGPALFEGQTVYVTLPDHKQVADALHAKAKAYEALAARLRTALDDLLNGGGPAATARARARDVLSGADLLLADPVPPLETSKAVEAEQANLRG